MRTGPSLAVAMLLGIGSTGPQDAAASFNATAESALRTAILTDLDPFVPPSGSTRVSTQFRLFKVLNVDIASGELKLKIWRRTVWFDDRLKWDPADHGDITEFRAYPRNGIEWTLDNSLWLPAMYTTNTIVPEADSVEVGGAWIKNDGRVWHSAPGILELSCRFTNLVNFPRDVSLEPSAIADHRRLSATHACAAPSWAQTLSCPMEVSSWAHVDHTVRPSYFDADLEWGWPAAPLAAGLIWDEV